MMERLMSGWVKFTGEHARLLRMRRGSTERLQRECDELACRIDELDRRKRFIVAELNRREAKWPEEE